LTQNKSRVKYKLLFLLIFYGGPGGPMKNFANDLFKKIVKENVEIFFSEGKIHYPISKTGCITQVTLRKGTADILQKEIDVHQLIEQIIDQLLIEKPHFTPRMRGDYIRYELDKIALKYVGEGNILEALK
jgi:hypothetical protein